jgi:NhaP-type Na+/H+ or K+/H+ antiporter
MTSFLLGLLIGFVIGYPIGLFIDKIDKDMKNDAR